MNHSVDWYIEHKIIFIHFHDPVLTLDALLEVDRQVIAMLENAPASVHVVSDNRGLVKVPRNISGLLTAVKGLQHERTGWLIHINSGTRMIRVLSTLIARMVGFRYHRVNTMDEAFAFLRMKDETIDWTRADPSVLPRRTGPFSDV